MTIADSRVIQLINHTLGALVILLCLATLCIQFARKKTRYMGTMILTWACVMVMTSFSAVHVWESTEPSEIFNLWGYLETIFAILSGFAYIILVDSLSRETLEPIKLSLFSIYVGTSFYVSITNPMLGRSIFIYGLQATAGLIWFYYCVRIYRHAPSSLRYYTRINLLGSSTVFAAIGFGVSGFSNIIPGIEWVAVSVGFLLTTLAFLKQEQLAFLLPFRVLRLSVVHIDAGIPLFNYTWSSGRALIDEDLFSGMMHGLRLIIKETILKGEFRDINLDVASVIVNRAKSHPVMAVLVTRRTSRVLRQALVIFTERFVEKYQGAIAVPNDSMQFEGANCLVQECFNFLPDYD